MLSSRLFLHFLLDRERKTSPGTVKTKSFVQKNRDSLRWLVHTHRLSLKSSSTSHTDRTGLEPEEPHCPGISNCSSTRNRNCFTTAMNRHRKRKQTIGSQLNSPRNLAGGYLSRASSSLSSNSTCDCSFSRAQTIGRRNQNSFPAYGRTDQFAFEHSFSTEIPEGEKTQRKEALCTGNAPTLRPAPLPCNRRRRRRRLCPRRRHRRLRCRRPSVRRICASDRQSFKRNREQNDVFFIFFLQLFFGGLRVSWFDCNGLFFYTRPHCLPIGLFFLYSGRTRS